MTSKVSLNYLNGGSSQRLDHGESLGLIQGDFHLLFFDKERHVEHVFHGVAEVVGVDHEVEIADGALPVRLGKKTITLKTCTTMTQLNP